MLTFSHRNDTWQLWQEYNLGDIVKDISLSNICAFWFMCWMWCKCWQYNGDGNEIILVMIGNTVQGCTLQRRGRDWIGTMYKLPTIQIGQISVGTAHNFISNDWLRLWYTVSKLKCFSIDSAHYQQRFSTSWKLRLRLWGGDIHF